MSFRSPYWRPRTGCQLTPSGTPTTRDRLGIRQHLTEPSREAPSLPAGVFPQRHTDRLEECSDVGAVSFCEVVPAITRVAGHVPVQLIPRLAGVVHRH